MICAAQGCVADVYCKDLCQRHYRNLKKYGNPIAGRTSPIDAQREFDRLINLPRGEGCVIWPFTIDRDGYARWKATSTSRLICEAVHGPPPNKNDHAAHICGKGNTGCVAWWHLGWKSAALNNADKVIHGTSSKGEINPTARITRDDVRLIRTSNESGAALARKLSVSRCIISNVRTGKTWSWLDDKYE